MRIALKDLPTAGLEGKHINVRRQGGKYHYDYQDRPMIRKFKKAYFKKEKGEKMRSYQSTRER